MLTTTGFTALASITSRQITSLAKPLPPGLFTRSTMAFTVLSSRALRMASLRVVPPILPSSPSPSTMSP